MALKELSNSLSLYGLDQLSLMYTDNMSDQQFLIRSFPSLAAGTSPIEKYHYLPEFSIPSNVVIRVFAQPQSINTAVDNILNDLSDDGASTLVVGFDTEWNVHIGSQDRVVGRGGTAVIQIAYKNCVYIFQVCS